MIYKGLLFLLGVSSSLWLPDINSAIYGGLFCLLFILVFYFSVWFKPALNKIKIFQIIRQYLSFLFFGVIWTSINIVIYSQLANPLTSNKANVEVEGIICSIPSYQYHRVQFDFCIDKLDGQSLSLLAYDKFKFSYDPSQNELVFAKNQDPNLLAGQSWHFIAKLEPPHGRYNEAGFDYQKWMLAEGYAGKGKIKQGSLSINSQPIFTSIFAYYHALRQDIYTYLYNLFPADQYRALLMALTLGERTDISQTQWEIFRQTGTSHLLAISGLHVGVAALWSYWLILWLWSSSERLCLIIPAQKTAQIASLFGAATILLLSGLGLPAQRAFLMLTIFIISRWLGVYYRLSSVIAIVIICVLLWQPFAVLSASFWLSFLAVLVIALVIGRQEYQSQKLHGWLNVNWYLYLAMLFISVLFFNQFSIVSFIANLILIPITSFLLIPVLYGGLLLTLFNQTIAVWLFDISSKIMSLIDWIQINLSELNQFIINTSVNTMSQMSILIGLLFLFVLMLPNKFYSKVIFLPILLMFSLSFLVKPEKKIFEMVVFDIGQGLAIYIETPEGNLIYDTGWGNDEFSMASSTILV